MPLQLCQHLHAALLRLLVVLHLEVLETLVQRELEHLVVFYCYFDCDYFDGLYEAGVDVGVQGDVALEELDCLEDGLVEEVAPDAEGDDSFD